MFPLEAFSFGSLDNWFCFDWTVGFVWLFAAFGDRFEGFVWFVGLGCGVVFVWTVAFLDLGLNWTVFGWGWTFGFLVTVVGLVMIIGFEWLIGWRIGDVFFVSVTDTWSYTRFYFGCGLSYYHARP